MILVDTSIWITHLRHGNGALEGLLNRGEVASHAFIIGELACGHLKRRAEVLTLLGRLQRLPIARHEESLELLERRDLMGRGLGWIDVHLLASSLIGAVPLWTFDRRLKEAALSLRAYREP